MSIIPKSSDAHGNRSWKVTTNPSIDPVTVDELKLFCRIDGTEEDELLANFITAATLMTERHLGRALIQQSITLLMDFWPGEIIDLPRPPLISITSVATLDEDDTATAYSSSNYYTITQSIPGKLVLKQSVTWPSNTSRSYCGFKIIYKAGYGIGSTQVPQPIREGIKVWASEMYEGRTIDEDKPPPRVLPLLSSYRVPRYVY